MKHHSRRIEGTKPTNKIKAQNIMKKEIRVYSSIGYCMAPESPKGETFYIRFVSGGPKRLARFDGKMHNGHKCVDFVSKK